MITKTDLDRVLGEHFGHEGDKLADLGTGYHAYSAESGTYWAFNLLDGMVHATEVKHGRTADDADDLGTFLEFMLS